MSELVREYKDLMGNEHQTGSQIVRDSKEASQGTLTSKKFCVFWHPACAEHCIPHHPEQPDRVRYMLDMLMSQNWSEKGGETSSD